MEVDGKARRSGASPPSRYFKQSISNLPESQIVVVLIRIFWGKEKPVGLDAGCATLFDVHVCPGIDNKHIVGLDYATFLISSGVPM